MESNYSFVSSKTTDQSGNTAKTELNSYNNRFTLNVNYDLFPKLNLNAGGTFEKNIADPVGEEETIRKTDVTRLRPYIWLTFRDPTYNAALGYDLREDTLKTSGLKTTLMQENYNVSFDWKPEGLPRTQFRYTKTNTHDGDRSVLDTEEDYFFLKSQYLYKGLDVYYTGTYRDFRNKVLDFESTEFFNEGRLLYSTTLFNGRTSLSSDNRLNVTTVDTKATGGGQLSFPVFPFAGLSVLDNTPLDGALDTNPALIDGNLSDGAGVNIGRPPIGGDTRLRNIGIDFLSPVEINSLQVWVNQELPLAITNAYTWDIYTSTDNLNWTRYRTLPFAPFAFGLNRFELNFPNVRTRYIKVVTSPLSIPDPPGFTTGDILITEIQAFINRPVQDVKGSQTRVFQNYTLDVKTRILNAPVLYHDFNAYFTYADPDGQQRYNVSNGLFLNHSFSPILSTSANASIDFGSESDDSRVAFLYYASLLATPLRTLSNNLVFSGINQFVEGVASRSNSIILYNTAQLYRGIDANLNLGLAFTSNEQDTGGTIDRREAYVNIGTNITPRPDLTLTLYYLGKLSHASGGSREGPADTTENRFDLAASWLPLRSLFFSAAVSAVVQTDTETTVQQNYGLSWAPFPDGQLQLSLYYNESHSPNRSRLLQPTLRWYLGARRRSYIDVSYQMTRSESGGQKTDTDIISSTLKIYF